MKDLFKITFILLVGIFLSAVPYLPADPTTKNLGQIARKRSNASDPLANIKTNLGHWFDMAAAGVHDANDYGSEADHLTLTGTNHAYVDGEGEVTANDSRWNTGGTSEVLNGSTDSGTIAVRFKVDTAIVANDRAMRAHGGASLISIASSGNGIIGDIKGILVNTTMAGAIDTWYLVIVRATYVDGAGNDSVSVLINDSPPAVSSATGTLGSVTASALWLARGGSAAGSVNMHIDWAAAWSRVLTNEECTGLYNGGATITFADLP